ncbi:MAG: hypothetical protein AAF355_11145 [Myxococcota bacterium]
MTNAVVFDRLALRLPDRVRFRLLTDLTRYGSSELSDLTRYGSTLTGYGFYLTDLTGYGSSTVSTT